ncbi:hypothetical protein KSP40_PGU018530 [Platanthera guangdongensis]|uniref:Uncharacterized protein n=1 Tax=Platanthera guangdongensis TaxID=2320717 RepID=A0ABR2LDC0_9ASPA
MITELKFRGLLFADREWLFANRKKCFFLGSKAQAVSFFLFSNQNQNPSFSPPILALSGRRRSADRSARHLPLAPLTGEEESIAPPLAAVCKGGPSLRRQKLGHFRACNGEARRRRGCALFSPASSSRSISQEMPASSADCCSES